MNLVTKLEVKGVHLQGSPQNLLLFQGDFHCRFGHLTLKTFLAVELLGNCQGSTISSSCSEGLHQGSVARMAAKSMKLEDALGQML